MKSLLPAVTAALLLAACGPGMDVTRPGQEDAKVTLDADGKLDVSMAMWGWDLQPAGECGDREDCGHLHVYVFTQTKTGEHSWEGQQCAPVGAPQEFDTTSFKLDLSRCSRQEGLFSLAISLANDDHVESQGTGVAAHRRFIVTR